MRLCRCAAQRVFFFGLLGITGCTSAFSQSPVEAPAAMGEPARLVKKPDLPMDAMVRNNTKRFTLAALAPAAIAERKRQFNTAVGQNRQVAADRMGGRWLRDSQGKAVWSAALQVPEAEGLRLHFQDFHVDSGEVRIHNGTPESGQVFGPYTGRGPLEDGEFWTELIDRDIIWVEYRPGDGQSAGDPPFSIPEVYQLWPGFALGAPPPGANLSCFLDLSCFEGSAANLGNFSRAVAFLIFANSTCSGTLINDRNSTQTPYFLTAGHCIQNDNDARTMLAVFSYKTSGCGGVVKGPYPQVAGSTLLARGAHLVGNGGIIPDQPDFAFVRLAKFPEAAWSSMGWAFNPSSTERLTSVSHPRGLTQTLAAANIIESSNPYFLTVRMFQGAVDHGSSGSGLNNDSNQLVGLDSYGSNTDAVSACDATDRIAGYTKFAAVYPSIRQWLEAVPQAVGQIAPTSLNFGSQQVRTTGGAQTATLTNIGQQSLSISGITLQGANSSEFSQTNTCGSSLAPGASCVLRVVFQPSSSGAKAASAVIASNHTGGALTVALSGTATDSRPAPTVLNQVISSVNGLQSGSCVVPPAVSVLPTTASAAWLYFDVTGTAPTDVYNIVYFRPDGSQYAAFTARPPATGYACFSYFIYVAGYPPASVPGVWTVRTFWNNSTTPLVTREFTLVPPSNLPIVSNFSASPTATAAGSAVTLSWSVLAATSISISPSVGTVAASGSRTVNPNATTTYTLTATNNSGTSTATATVTVGGNSSRPAVNAGGVVTVAASAEAVSPLALVSIYGQRFTNGVTQNWDGARLATSLAGVSVTIDGKPAYPLHVSPTFLNVQVPDSVASGAVAVTVTNANGTSDPVSVQMRTMTPEFKSWSPVYVEAIRSGPNPPAAPSCPLPACPVAPTGLIPFSAPARPGETISLWGLGWGPSDPRIAAGTIGTTPARLTNPVSVTIGGVEAPVPYGAFLQGVGLYQVNVVVPNLPDGDHDVVATIGGTRVLKTLKLPVRR